MGHLFNAILLATFISLILILPAQWQIEKNFDKQRASEFQLQLEKESLKYGE